MFYIDSKYNMFAYLIMCSAVLAILCSLLLGLGDSCFNTQILSILGGMYPDDSAPAFAIFKFTQSLSAAGSFFYSNQVKKRANNYETFVCRKISVMSSKQSSEIAINQILRIAICPNLKTTFRRLILN